MRVFELIFLDGVVYIVWEVHTRKPRLPCLLFNSHTVNLLILQQFLLLINRICSFILLILQSSLDIISEFLGESFSYHFGSIFF